MNKISHFSYQLASGGGTALTVPPTELGSKKI